MAGVKVFLYLIYARISCMLAENPFLGYEASDSGIYQGNYNRGWYRRIRDFFGASYHILLTAGVYASGIAVVVSAILLILNARNRVELGETKKYVKRVMLLCIAIFCVCGIVDLVYKVGQKL